MILYQYKTNMSGVNTIDKFGRKRKFKESPYTRGPSGTGFKLTSDGNYDIDQKRLCYLGEPIEGGDGVTRNYVDFHLAKCVQDTRKAVEDSTYIVIDSVKKHLEGHVHYRISEIITQMKEYINNEINKNFNDRMNKLDNLIV